jgi:Phasin protein
MGKPRSGEPAEAFSSEVGTTSREENASNKKRPARRSIVELTEAARRAADDGLLPPVAVAPASDQPRPASGRTISFDAVDVGTEVSPSSLPGLSRPSPSSPAARKQDVDAQQPSTPEASRASVEVRRSFSEGGPKAGHDEPVEAVDCSGRTEAVERSILSDSRAADGEREKHGSELPHPAASGTCELNGSDSSADMAVKIAKAYQANTLDDIKLGFSAALEYAAELAKGRASSDAASAHAAADPDDHGRNTLAEEYRAEAVELMKANVATTLDFARRLLGAKTSAEWVVLASTHARTQCELMVQQGRALRSLARSMTGPAAGQADPHGPTPRK